MTIEITVVCGVLAVLIAGVIAMMIQGNRAVKRAELELQRQQLQPPLSPYRPGAHRQMQKRGPDK